MKWVWLRWSSSNVLAYQKSTHVLVQYVCLLQQHTEACSSPGQTLETLSNISKQSFSTFIVPYTKFTAISSQSSFGNAQKLFFIPTFLSLSHHTVASFIFRELWRIHSLCMELSPIIADYFLLTVIICNTWNSSGQKWFIKTENISKMRDETVFLFLKCWKLKK